MEQDKSFIESITSPESLTNIVVGVVIGLLVLLIPYFLKLINSKIKKPKPFLKEGTYDLSRLPLPPNNILFGRTKNLAALTRALNKDNRDLVWIHAVGGAGKSALLYRWLDDLRNKKYKDLDKAFAWSFHNQDGQQRQTGSSDFFIQVLGHFGVKAQDIPQDDVAKAQSLAQILQKQPSLLVLDGMETLQYPQGLKSFSGELQDMAMTTFLKSVHRNGLVKSPSLIIVTSRLPLQEFEKWDESRYVAMSLDNLSDADGMKLLKELGAKDTKQKIKWKNSENEWLERLQGEAVSADLHGHALSLVLLGHLVKTELNGHLELRDQLPHLWEAKEFSDIVHEILDFYIQRWGKKKRPESIFMHLLGLFDQAMQKDEFDMLLYDLPYAFQLRSWQKQGKLDEIYDNLETAGLLSIKMQDKERVAWDTHPLIRSYFAEHFKKTKPAEYKKAHYVLFEYYEDLPNEYHPEGLTGLEPLYHAVKHGCLAEEYQRALDNVYYERIERGGKEAYSLNKLGAYNQDLIAIAGFFPQNWSHSVQGLSESAQGFLLSEASFCLMSLGRLNEALEPRQADLKLRQKLKDWENASTTALNLVELHLALGSLQQATENAQLAIDYAQQSGDDFEQIKSHAYLASCLHLQGQLAEALPSFQQAEKLEQNRGNQYLSSGTGFYYCTLLLDQAPTTADIEHVLQRGEYGLEISQQTNFLQDIAKDKLTLARCYQALKSAQAISYFDEAVTAIRKAGKIQYLPMFLIDRANFHLQQQNLKAAKPDLDEAHDIIERCKMKRYATDWHLAMCRYELITGDKDKAIEHRNQAEKLINETGYHLRDKDLTILSQQ
ncbi:tetratricopeptide repeat protein [Candidatus Albibeggiatoa sp. nov. BB20]|uniref:tetratricopeptide repeat protein n=1 Tax=Candidatus Albibeggiatoa sp. nov. BB20 TaxID=3162723 RepID=UPI0033653DF3